MILPNRYTRFLRLPNLLLLLVSGIFLSGTLSGCSKPQSLLEKVQAKGELVIVTLNDATSYSRDPDGESGFEFDLATLFAEQLKVKLTVQTVDTLDDLLGVIASGKADLAAAGLSITPARKELVRFGPIYQEVIPYVVYREGAEIPKDIADLQNKQIEVVANSAHAEQLRQLKIKYPDLTWEEQESGSSDELLYLVWENVLDYTIADSTQFQINQPQFPELRAGIPISDGEKIAWAFPLTEDTSLYEAAKVFFAQSKQDGSLSQLVDRYYSHVSEFDYVGTKRFVFHIRERLSLYEDFFQDAAAKYGLDWQLLAAIAYQESHWTIDTVSPTGVRGIMMLTESTANHLGVEDRLDPKSSIFGGAKYFSRLYQQISDKTLEPDRTWLALAAYNMGLKHLEDARDLTRKRNANPDSWLDVKKTLPLLSQKKIFKKTKYGFTRGTEAIKYVENVRGYYDHLKKIEQQKYPLQAQRINATSIFVGLNRSF